MLELASHILHLLYTCNYNIVRKTAEEFETFNVTFGTSASRSASISLDTLEGVFHFSNTQTANRNKLGNDKRALDSN